MKKINYIVLPFIALFFISCGGDKKVEEQKMEEPKIDSVAYEKAELVNKIKAIEARMHQSPQLDKTIGVSAIQIYFEYANKYPQDSITPDYLFKSAEIATALQQYSQALNCYQGIVAHYPNYKMIQESLFLQAVLLDNYLNEDEKARVVYNQLIEKYPNGPYTDDAKAAINNLGKTDEELIKEFEKKNKRSEVFKRIPSPIIPSNARE